jgi:pimeloyl-ACP methyl ester carboxylesterase
VIEVSGPARSSWVETPLRLHVVEWGPVAGPLLVLVHGGGDFARAFDGFAPLLAEAGWRVAAWDQRGHGDSERAALYGYGSDLRDAVAVVDQLGDGRPAVLVGHSKGGLLAIEVAVARPDLVAAVVALDGFTRRRAWTEPTPVVAGRWCVGRRAARPFRAGPLEQLAARRAAQNPRLDLAWATYLVSVGGQQGEDGLWRWKLDPAAFPPPPHPWPTEASLDVLGQVRRPFLALKAGIEEPMAAQPAADVLARHLPPTARLEVLDGLGHFAHVEDSPRVARAVLDFLAETAATH